MGLAEVAPPTPSNALLVDQIRSHELRSSSACSPSRSLTLSSLPQGLVLPRPGSSRGDPRYMLVSMEMINLTRDGTAEPDSRDQILRRERGQRIINFFCSAADHEQYWQPCPVVRAIHTSIVVLHKHTTVVVTDIYIHVHIIQQQKSTVHECVCVCVFSSHSSFRGHTGGRSHRISHPPSFCGPCLNFFREKDSAVSFPRRP